MYHKYASFITPTGIYHRNKAQVFNLLEFACYEQSKYTQDYSHIASNPVNIRKY